jgi:hypothetical protein
MGFAGFLETKFYYRKVAFWGRNFVHLDKIIALSMKTTKYYCGFIMFHYNM